MAPDVLNYLKHIQHIDRLTAFGLLAVSLMLLFYALERRSPWATLGFAGACVMGCVYGFLQGAWPFGVIEAIWSAVALRRWWISRRSAPKPQPAPNVGEFMEALKSVARPAGQGYFAFSNAQGKCSGFVQFIPVSDRRLTIHRVWALRPLQGDGRRILRTLCELADRHGVELALKALPFGRKPFPISRPELKQWYQSLGFVGEKWKLLRLPLSPASASESESPGEMSPAPLTRG